MNKPTNQKLIKLAKMLIKFEDISTDKGVLVSADEIGVGVEVFVEDENGEWVLAQDGEYITEDSKITVEGGKISEIVPLEAEGASEGEGEDPNNADSTEEDNAKDLKIQELEGLLKDRDAIIAELTEKIKVLEEELRKPVESEIELKSQVDEKAEKIKQNPALRYFQ